jgi:hypothetical protein
MTTPSKRRGSSLPPENLLVIDHDAAAGKALLRGPRADHIATTMPGIFTWSHRGNGWVITDEQLPDVYAFAQWKRYIVKVTHRLGRT